MSGRWLEEHGFPIGSAVRVEVEHGRVTLTASCRRRRMRFEAGAMPTTGQ